MFDDVQSGRFKSATGTAISFTSIDGVGPATAKKITSLRGVNAPRDVQDMSADELSDKVSGVGRSLARKIISESGGNPGVSKTSDSNLSNISAAGMTVPVGEFVIDAGADDKARARNDTYSRSREAIRQDDQKRAPVTTDFERWNENKAKYDFPGVDTPTQRPKVLPKDLKQKPQPRTTDPESTPGPQPLPSASRFQGIPQSERMAALSRTVSETGTTATPGEIFRGVGASSSGNIGGFVPGVGETDRPDEDETPPDIARGLVPTASDDDRDDITFIYEEEGVRDRMSLSQFRRRTKRVKRQMGGVADDWAAARIVSTEEDR